MVDEAATLIPAERLALCLVVQSGSDTLHAAAFGTPEGIEGVAAFNEKRKPDFTPG